MREPEQKGENNQHCAVPCSSSKNGKWIRVLKAAENNIDQLSGRMHLPPPPPPPQPDGFLQNVLVVLDKYCNQQMRTDFLSQLTRLDRCEKPLQQVGLRQQRGYNQSSFWFWNICLHPERPRYRVWCYAIMDIARTLSKCTGNATTRPAVVADLDSGCLLSFACLGTDCLDVHVNHHFTKVLGLLLNFAAAKVSGRSRFLSCVVGWGSWVVANRIEAALVNDSTYQPVRSRSSKLVRATGPSCTLVAVL